MVPSMNPLHEDILRKFADGEISRRQAMHMLGVGYSEMLDMMAAMGLELPQVSDDEAKRMANKMNEILDKYANVR
jgi:hypothetical protein